MATQKIYSDIDLTFNKQSGRGDISLKYNDQAVIASVRNLLSTDFFERPFQPEIGTNLNSLLFELISPITASAIEDEIRNVLTNFEPRALIKDIQVDAMPDQNSFFVSVTFYIGNSTSPVAVNLLLQRNR